MRTPAAVVEELRELDQVLEVFGTGGDTLTPGARAMRDTLYERRDRLTEELRLASIGKERPLLTFLVDGPPALASMLSARLAGRILVELQDLITAAGQALTGRPTWRGSVPTETARLTDLGVAGVAYGSFGFVLQAPPSLIQERLFEPPEPSLAEQAMQHLANTIKAGATSSDDFLNDIADLGPRFSGHLSRFASMLVEYHAGAEIIIEGPLIERQVLDVPFAELESLSESIDTIETATYSETMTGTLAGALTLSGRFEFERDDHVVLRGRIDPYLRDKVADYFLAHCGVRMEVTRTTAQSTGKVGFSYRINDVFEA